MRWYQYAINPVAVEQIYSTVPELQGVLLQVNFMVQTQRVSLKLELERYPDNPSPRWDQRANTIAMELSLFEVTEAYMLTLPQPSSVLSFSVVKKDDGRLSLWSNDNKLLINFGSFSIDRFDTYIST